MKAAERAKDHSHKRPYHSRIFRLYIEYLKDNLAWSDRDVESLLSELGTSQARINDDACWVDLEFADNFYDLILSKTGDKEIAFHAGLYVKMSAISSTIYYVMRGLVSLGRLYELVSRFTPHFTKATALKVLERKHQHALIENQVLIPGHERPYMCENRKGILRGLPRIFNLPLADLEEIECIHRGNTRCLYSVRWKERTNFRFFFSSTLANFVLTGAAWGYLGRPAAVYVLVTVFISSLFIFFIRKLREKSLEAVNQNLVLESAVKDIEKKNRELELISHISRMTHSLTRPEQIFELVVRNVCELLNYDRSILLLVDPTRNVLKVVAHFGYDEATTDLLNEAEFNIRPDNTTGFFIKVVNTAEPVLIENVESHVSQLSQRSQRFAKILGAHSFVAVPLKDTGGRVIGVLSVDNLDEAKSITISDQDLLLMLADHISIAIHNKTTLDNLQETLQVVRQQADHQKLLTNAFQKFIPTDLARDLCQTLDPDIHKRLLKSVKSKSAAILFADIFGFSELSQRLRPDEVVEYLNYSFSQVEPVIRSYGGYVDKFTGDGFLAIFESEDCCKAAVKAAGEIILMLPKVSASLHQKGLPVIEVGIGIHFGSVIIGNVGSEERLNLTVIGEVVNLASRLEGHTRELGPNTVCVSAPVQVQAADLYEWKNLGEILLKGYKNPVQAYELVIGKLPANLIQFPKEKSSD